MTSLHLKYLVVFLTTAGLFHPSQAQEAEQVSIQFVSFPKYPSPEPAELFLGEGKTIEVKIPSNTLSEPYLVPAIATWAVGQTEIGTEEKKIFKIFGQAHALGSKNQLIILIRRGVNNSDGMEVIPIDNQNANFGGGKFLFMNTSKVDIAGEVGDEKFVIKPGARSLIKPESKEGAKTFHTMFYFGKDEEAKPFFSSKWPVSDKARSLVFFYHDPNNQRIRFHTVRNFIQE